MIPIVWRGYVSKETVRFKKEFDQSDNLKRNFNNIIHSEIKIYVM